jgi:hypothetical protein
MGWTAGGILFEVSGCHSREGGNPDVMNWTANAPSVTKRVLSAGKVARMKKNGENLAQQARISKKVEHENTKN